MVYSQGNIIVVAKSERYVPIQIVDEDGGAVDITGTVSAQLRLVNIHDNTDLKTFSTNDDSPILFLDNDLTTGKLELRPTTETFTEEGTYRYQIWLYDSTRRYSVPDNGKETYYTWTVNADIEQEGAES